MNQDKPEPEPEPAADEPAAEPRKPGRLKGLIVMDDGFFEPLPEDELRQWEGCMPKSGDIADDWPE